MKPIQLCKFIFFVSTVVVIKVFFTDPVVFVSFLNQCRRTAVIRHTLNPVWDQTLMMDIAFYGDLRLLQKFCSDVVLEIFDKDDVVSSRIFTLNLLNTVKNRHRVASSLFATIHKTARIDQH